MRAPLLLILCVALSTSAWAQSELGTDRPDQTESSSVVPPGFLQAEMGFERHVLHASADDIEFLRETDYAAPALLLRLGLVEAIELRIGMEWMHSTLWSDPRHLSRDEAYYPPSERTVKGLLPLQVGTKVALFPEEGFRPESALILMAELPGSASEVFDIDRGIYEARLACSHALGERFSLGWNLAATFGEGAGHTLGLYTLAFGMGVTETLGCYVELYGDFDPRQFPQHRFDGGVTFAPVPTLQLDASAGVALSDPWRPYATEKNQEGDAWFVGMGASWRVGLWGE